MLQRLKATDVKAVRGIRRLAPGRVQMENTSPFSRDPAVDASRSCSTQSIVALTTSKQQKQDFEEALGLDCR
jgi:hypothetical protein